MKMSRELQAKYEQNRLAMTKVEQDYKLFLRLSLVLSVIWFACAFFVGALSTTNEGQQAQTIFYRAMGTGMAHFLLAAATIVLGWMVAAKKRLAGLILLALNVLCTILVVLNKTVSLAAFDILLLVAGIVLNVWGQMISSRNDILREEPGYPLFSIEADTPAEYELPLHLRNRQAADHMDTIGGEAKPAGPAQPAHAMMSLQPPETPMQFSEMTGGGTQMRPSEDTLTVPDHLSFDNFNTAAQTQSQPAAAPAQPEAADFLVEMTPETAQRNYTPNMEALPTPEEVRARLAAMKAEREKK